MRIQEGFFQAKVERLETLHLVTNSILLLLVRHLLLVAWHLLLVASCSKVSKIHDHVGG